MNTTSLRLPLFAICGVVATIFYLQERSFSMELSTNSFQNGQMMDKKYTCDGSDISPHLAWSDAPSGTKSFAISCVDPDAPMGDWIHWLVCNIPADVNHIPEGGPVPAGSVVIVNDFRKTNYGGPCPPGGTHRYYFTVYALDTESISPVGKNEFFKQVEAHTIEKKQVMGTYSRQRR